MTMRPGVRAEAAFMAEVVQVAAANGWHVYHAAMVGRRLRSWTSIGFPDLILASDASEMIAAELKVRGGTSTVDQRAWLRRFGLVAGCTAALWRPDDPPRRERWEGLTETAEGRDFGAIGRRLRRALEGTP